MALQRQGGGVHSCSQAEDITRCLSIRAGISEMNIPMQIPLFLLPRITLPRPSHEMHFVFLEAVGLSSTKASESKSVLVQLQMSVNL